MLRDLQPQPEDKILQLMQMYRDDPRQQKIDLGVGVYRNADGQTPVMRAVKAAERRLVEEETTKSYTALAGDSAFSQALSGLVLGPARAPERLAACATPGGTGAIRQALELVKMVSPTATVWVPAPTWPNHISIIRYLDIPMAEYRYFDSSTRDVDFSAMMQDLGAVKTGDIVLLHGCCHNPTGANLTQDQWRDVIVLMQDRGAVPLVDIAYQGFGDGLDQDAAAVRMVAAEMPECLIAASCSKNFGIYRERTGLLMAVAPGARVQPVTQQNLAHLNRQNYSFPPDHGARLVTMVLDDANLRADWQAELDDMRTGMLDLRIQLASELRQRTNSDRFDFIARHRGMFSRIGATPEQVGDLRDKFGIYMVGDSRINIAGLNAQTVPVVAEAIVEVGV